MQAAQNIPRRILVVDDEPLVGDAIKRILESEKHQVQTATSSQAGLAAFAEAKFDLIILDYDLPLMKGDKVAAAIKQQSPAQPVMMVTAYGEALRFGGSFPLGVDLVLTKPFDSREFLDAVRRLTVAQ
ncbi:MAG TPA: response regulator [Verrucomicrobiae bacterium]|nr:response regulator [Verrucomicrobiae bacterium]